jgi:hypothetical protein
MNPFRRNPLSIAHPRRFKRNWSDAGFNFALRQVTVARDALSTEFIF